MPEKGERKTIGGVTGEWDGQTWRKVLAPLATPSHEGEPGFANELGRYGKELLTGTGTARGEVANYGKKELGGFLHSINPINQVKGAVNTVLHPIDTLSAIPQQVSDVASGDPEAVGGALGMVVAPKMDAALLRGTNRVATKLAESPDARAALGYGGGAITSLATGVGHPFIGGILGRNLAKYGLGGIAEDAASGTNWLMDKLGMNGEPGVLSAADKADMAAKGYTPETIAEIERRLQAKAAGGAGGGQGPSSGPRNGPGEGGGSPPPGPAAPRTPPQSPRTPPSGAGSTSSSTGTGASTPPLNEVRANLPPELRTASEATGTRDALAPPAENGPTLSPEDATHEALMQKFGGGLPDFEVVGDEAGPQTNASGESAASGEAISRQASMKGAGQQFVVYDRAGNARPLIGPEAVDYNPRPGETYGVQDAQGFRTLTDNGGRVPSQGAMGRTPGSTPPSSPVLDPEAQSIRDQTGGAYQPPDAPAATTRLYRGESSASTPGPDAGTNFTDDPLSAAYYAKQGGGAGQTFYIDLPADQAASFRTADATGQGVHVLPPDLAQQARGNVLGAGIPEGTSIIKPKPGPILQQPPQPLGLPKVKAWKPGFGPSADAAATYREQFGSRDAAARLKTTLGQIKNLTPDMETQLPARARAAIDAQLSQLSGPDLEAYLQSAPHPLAKAYILQKLGRVE